MTTENMFSHLYKEFKQHGFDYLLLITAGICFLISIQIFRGERLLEFLMLLLFVSFYIIWGVYHHTINKNIHLKTILEYVIIGFTIIFLLKTIVLP